MLDLESSAVRRESSNLSLGTNLKCYALEAQLDEHPATMKHGRITKK